MVTDFVSKNISIVKSVHDTIQYTQFSQLSEIMKLPQTITEPPPCLIVEIVPFGSNPSHGVLKIITLPFQRESLNFH